MASGVTSHKTLFKLASDFGFSASFFGTEWHNFCYWYSMIVMKTKAKYIKFQIRRIEIKTFPAFHYLDRCSNHHMQILFALHLDKKFLRDYLSLVLLSSCCMVWLDRFWVPCWKWHLDLLKRKRGHTKPVTENSQIIQFFRCFYCRIIGCTSFKLQSFITQTTTLCLSTSTHWSAKNI